MHVKGPHAYKDIWTPKTGGSHDAHIEANNPVDKYAVYIRKFGKVVGNLRKGEDSKFANTIFFFLRRDPYSKAKTITSGSRCNFGDSESLQAPHKLASKNVSLPE